VRPHNHVGTAGFLRMTGEAGLPYKQETARYFLKQHSSLGNITQEVGKSKKYTFYRDKVEEFIFFKKNIHMEWYSLAALTKETNHKKIKESLWRHNFQYLLVYKLGIIPKKIYGMAFVPREKVDGIKQYINPIRSNIR